MNMRNKKSVEFHSPLIFLVIFLSWIPIIEYINEQYEKYLSEEISITRKKHIPDSRVHVCLYFVAPTGHK